LLHCVRKDDGKRVEGEEMQWIICIVFLMKSFALSYASSGVLNNPYPQSELGKNIFYSSFTEQPKTLDPALSYSLNEYLFISSIYEPLLEYDYFLRPYQLKPLIAAEWPQVKYLDAQGKLLTGGSKIEPEFTVYTLKIKKGIFYQPHPAFARNKLGNYLYHHLSKDYLNKYNINQLSDFKHTGTRELVVDDYIYQIKRLANPAVSSPIYGLMSEHILGFKQYGKSLPKSASYVDLRAYPLEGLKKLNDYTFEITVKGQYTQFLFWLAMTFFSPMPWEADLFYSQAGMSNKNLSLGWYPVGTGAFMLIKNNPNYSMVLKKNPNFHQEYFPLGGSDQDRKKGYSEHAGERLPLIDMAIFTLEKESIPRWNKFLQGYYDNSIVGSDSFDQAIYINKQGIVSLTPEMQEKKMYLTQTLEAGIHYMGFNMLDGIVGGQSERARKLRQAISIAVNYDEHIAIFYNGRGIAAQGPIPPGIFGHKAGKAGINPYVYEWKGNEAVRRSLNDARKLMAEAGYPQGIDPATGKSLILHYDAITTGGPEDKALFDWMRKQFAQIGIELNVRATLYNRFQEKMRVGDTQIFSWGWIADYPDPENFLFQLYGGNGKVRYGGENATNYQNPEFDRLFNLMKNRKNDVIREQIIEKMVAIVLRDAPWAWGIYSENFILSQYWLSHTKPNTISLGTLKYVAINVSEREQLRQQWNQVIFWPLGLLLVLILALIVPLIVAYLRKERKPAQRIHSL
jgi:ABC-type transport system substrate-binding protein